DLGRAYLALDAWDDVLKEATTILQREPANLDAFYFRAAALSAKGQSQEALNDIDKVLASGQSSPEFQTVKGDALSRLEKFGDAEQAYRSALAQNPKYARALVGLSDLFRRQNKPDEARRFLDQAKANDPNDARVRMSLSALLASTGKREEALK